MLTTWIRRAADRRVAIAATVLVVALAVAFAYRGLVVHGTFGTTPLEGADAIAQLESDDSSGDYVDVSGEATIDTGVSRETVTDGKSSTDYRVVALAIQDRILLVKVDEPTEAVHFRGLTEPLSSELSDAIVESAGDSGASLTPRLLPVTVDATTDWKFLGTLSSAGLALLAVAVAVALVLAIRKRTAPWTSRALRRFPDPASTLAAVDAELARPHRFIGKQAAICPSFLVVRRGPKVVETARIVWIYRKVTTQRVYGVVPAGKVREMQIALDDGKVLSVREGRRGALTIEQVHPFAPWAFVGFDPTLSNAWARQRSEMIAAARARRDAPPPPGGPQRSAWDVGPAPDPRR